MKKENEVLVKENEAAKDILVENEKELEQLRRERGLVERELHRQRCFPAEQHRTDKLEEVAGQKSGGL